MNESRRRSIFARLIVNRGVSAPHQTGLGHVFPSLAFDLGVFCLQNLSSGRREQIPTRESRVLKRTSFLSQGG